MFIIAAAGTVKALMAVTISLHPGTHHVPASYTVQQGDSLSAIAAHTYGKAADWPAVWWVNRHQVANPNLIAAGQRLRLPASGQVPEWMARAAQAAIPTPPPAPAAVSVTQANPPAAAGTCIIAKEGYPDVTQFDPAADHYDPDSDEENPRWFMVDIAYRSVFKKPVMLPQLKANPKLKAMRLLARGNRLSVMPVTKAEFEEIERMAAK